MTPAASLIDSANRFAKLGHTESARLTRRMAEEARVWPELYEHWANAQRERADREECRVLQPRERRVKSGDK